MPTLSSEFEIVNAKGLHARAATVLVKEASKFESEIIIHRGDVNSNAASVMGLLILAAPVGSTIRVEVTGPDAEAAMLAVGDLIRSGFGE